MLGMVFLRSSNMKLVLRFLLFLLLTILTQVGGLVYLLSSYLSRRVFRTQRRWKRMLFFMFLYVCATWFLVPVLSPRKAMPVFFEKDGYKPVTILTCLLNRHYVNQEFYEVLRSVPSRTTIQYMDANFPFFDGFPLLPHLSHDDGRKIDLAFQYGTGGTDMENLKLPTFIGYGSFELPSEDEVNTVAVCKDRGAWLYSLTSIFPTRNTEATFHHYRTQKLVKILAKTPEIDKIFIEPHLKHRMGLSSSKVRFHGCHAVRHDDHIHVEMKVKD